MHLPRRRHPHPLPHGRPARAPAGSRALHADRRHARIAPCGLTARMGPVLDHWELSGGKAECVYSGCMACPEQTDDAAGDWRRCWPRAAVPWRTRCLATAGTSFSPCPGRRLARCAGASASIGHRAEHAELCRDVPAARRALRILPRGAAPQGLPEGSRRPRQERPPARACRWRAANGAVPAWAPERRLLAIRPCLCRGRGRGHSRHPDGAVRPGPDPGSGPGRMLLRLLDRAARPDEAWLCRRPCRRRQGLRALPA